MSHPSGVPRSVFAAPDTQPGVHSKGPFSLSPWRSAEGPAVLSLLWILLLQVLSWLPLHPFVSDFPISCTDEISCGVSVLALTL